MTCRQCSGPFHSPCTNSSNSRKHKLAANGFLSVKLRTGHGPDGARYPSARQIADPVHFPSQVVSSLRNMPSPSTSAQGGGDRFSAENNRHERFSGTIPVRYRFAPPRSSIAPPCQLLRCRLSRNGKAIRILSFLRRAAIKLVSRACVELTRTIRFEDGARGNCISGERHRSRDRAFSSKIGSP